MPGVSCKAVATQNSSEWPCSMCPFPQLRLVGVRTSYIYFSKISWTPWVLEPITNSFLGPSSWLHPVSVWEWERKFQYLSWVPYTLTWQNTFNTAGKWSVKWDKDRDPGAGVESEIGCPHNRSWPSPFLLVPAENLRGGGSTVGEASTSSWEVLGKTKI